MSETENQVKPYTIGGIEVEQESIAKVVESLDPGTMINLEEVLAKAATLNETDKDHALKKQEEIKKILSEADHNPLQLEQLDEMSNKLLGYLDNKGLLQDGRWIRKKADSNQP